MKIASFEVLYELCRNNHQKMEALAKQHGFKFDDIETNNIIGLAKAYFIREMSRRNGELVQRYLFWRKEIHGVSPVIDRLFAPYNRAIRGEYMVCDIVWPTESGQSPALRGFACGGVTNMIKLFFTASRTELNAKRAAILGKLSDAKLCSIDIMMRKEIQEQEDKIHAQTKKAVDALHARHKPQIAEVERLLANARDKRDAEEGAQYYFRCFPGGDSQRFSTLSAAVRAYKRQDSSLNGNCNDYMRRVLPNGDQQYLGHPSKF